MNAEQTAALASDAEFIARCDDSRDAWIEAVEAAEAFTVDCGPDADTQEIV